MSNIKKYVSEDELQVALNDLANTFATVSHTHTKDEITDLDVSEIVNEVIKQLPSAEGSDF